MSRHKEPTPALPACIGQTLEDDLVATVLLLETEVEAYIFLQALLSDNELPAIAKRLRALWLLCEGLRPAVVQRLCHESG